MKQRTRNQAGMDTTETFVLILALFVALVILTKSLTYDYGESAHRVELVVIPMTSTSR